ncbi:MAG: hypothetical protein AAFO63_06735 [Pseudomonadota bacterium]
MRAIHYSGCLLATILAGCTTPGVSYQTRLMPASEAAAATRDVAVERFYGPAGGWYAREFEAMLANATLDGQSWFRLADYAYAPKGPVGIYSGDIDVVSHTFEDYTRTVSKCVEWDGLFDCETRVDVDEYCTREHLEVSVNPRLIDSVSGTVLFSSVYRGSASEKICDEHGYPGYGGFGYKRKTGLFGIGKFLPNSGLLYDALADTLHPIRIDIAPRNGTVKAVFVKEAVDPVVRADPRFEQAVKAGKDNPVFSCLTWEDLYAQYQTAPAVTHNHAACLEASGDLATAQRLFAQASETATGYVVEKDAARVFTRSLQRVSNQRYDQTVLEDLIAQDLELPVFGLDDPEADVALKPIG